MPPVLRPAPSPSCAPSPPLLQPAVRAPAAPGKRPFQSCRCGILGNSETKPAIETGLNEKTCVVREESLAFISCSSCSTVNTVPVGGSAEKMVQFLQSSVGIIHKSHAESITSFVKDSVIGELKEKSEVPVMQSTRDKRITFCVEGNISVGKCTFLQKIANETVELRDLVEIVPEPVSKWQDVGPDHFNILGVLWRIKPLRLVERSIFSDRMVFARAVREANWLNGMELSIYDSWFDPVLSSLPGLIPDGFIYLRATPDTCHKRMMLRSRAEEGSVTLQYLRDLHEKHECWLLPSEHGNHRLLSASQLPCSIDNSLHPDIKDRVFYLEGSHMHSSIQKVPALVLDCEPNIDFSRDVEAKRNDKWVTLFRCPVVPLPHAETTMT
ncbi:unnamed protein product [Miscanthus lutarioriparius]|uniref:Deoxynucleoside kinase domain-containing protein n=1 Tax=Miscanthus lutarioriparius TaxID=422564 RepID=A0A811NDS1_9POAL|nr:unnamed protein product [Miscanthus lutarioriparius]